MVRHSGRLARPHGRRRAIGTALRGAARGARGACLRRRRSNIADDAAGDLGRMWAQFGIAPEPGSHRHVRALLRSTLLESYFKTARSVQRFDQFGEGKGAAEAGRRALGGGLAGVVLYELLRLLQPAKARAVNYRGPDQWRPRGAQRACRTANQSRPPCAELGLVPGQLRVHLRGPRGARGRLPDPRVVPGAVPAGHGGPRRPAGRHGPSAPLAWDEPLGLNATTSGKASMAISPAWFLVGDDDHPVHASLWDRLRADIAAFNAGSQGEGVISETC